MDTKTLKGIGLSEGIHLLLLVFSIKVLIPSHLLEFFSFQYIVFLGFMLVANRKQSFIIYIAYIVTTSIFLLTLSFYWNSPVGEQLFNIRNHIVFILNNTMLYNIVSNRKKLFEENKALKEKLKTLEKYDFETEVLTDAEYEQRKILVLNTMKRRNENGYEIVIKVGSDFIETSDSVFNTLCRVAAKTFRADYDLVCNKNQTEMNILLQNANPEQKNIAMGRFWTNVKKELSYPEEAFIVAETKLFK